MPPEFQADVSLTVQNDIVIECTCSFNLNMADVICVIMKLALWFHFINHVHLGSQTGADISNQRISLKQVL